MFTDTRIAACTVEWIFHVYVYLFIICQHFVVFSPSNMHGKNVGCFVSEDYWRQLCTVKRVYSNHSRDQMMAFTDRWSSYRGALISLRWPMEQPTGVTIDRWSLYRGAVVSPRWPMEQPTGVTIDRWSLYRGYFSITEVAHGAACSGHYRQVVFLYKWSQGETGFTISSEMLLCECILIGAFLLCHLNFIILSTFIYSYT